MKRDSSLADRGKRQVHNVTWRSKHGTVYSAVKNGIMRARPLWCWIMLLIACISLFGTGLGAYGLLDPDEGRYASIPQQMLLFDDYITPRQNWVKFLDKPPLLYWGIASLYSVFGVHEWAARLVPTLAALTGILAVFVLGQRMFGTRAGIFGAIILASSLMWILMARFVVTDMLFSSLVFISLTLWWLGHTEAEANRRRQSQYFGGFWITLALATLAKGPIGVALCMGCILLYVAVCAKWQSLKHICWSWGIPLYLGIAAPWFVLVAIRNPEFNHFFWIDQHFGRFAGGTMNNSHKEAIGYYLPFLPVMMFPWSLLIPSAIFASWKMLLRAPDRFSSERKQSGLFLLSGICFILTLFSLSSGKLLTYILPIVPMVALSLGAYFDWLLQRNQGRNQAVLWAAALLAGLLAIGGGALTIFLPSLVEPFGVQRVVAAGIGLLLVLWALALIVSSQRYGVKGTVASIAGGGNLVVFAVLSVITTMMPHLSTKPLVNHILPGLKGNPLSQVVAVTYIRSLPFYAEKRVGILGMVSELQLGVKHMPPQERKKWFLAGNAEAATLRKKMLEFSPVYVFMRAPAREQKRVLDLIRAVGNGATIIAANERFVVFGNKAALAVTPARSARAGLQCSF